MKWVLLVDDDPEIRDVLALVIESHGHEVVAAADATEALRAVREKGPPALAVVDLRMPGMGGRELVEELRRLVRGRELRVVILSGDGSARAEVESLGVHRFLPKPVGLQDLLGTVDELASG